MRFETMPGLQGQMDWVFFEDHTVLEEHASTFLELQKTETAAKAKAIYLCKDLGLNTSKLTAEEWRG